MKELQVLNNNQKTIGSREIAEMLGKRHSDLLIDLEGRKDGKGVGIIPTLTNGNFPLVDYFIESKYKDSKGEIRKCYLITKMGCEILGNKQQGEKGILFTAKYVKKFNEMETKIVNSYMIEDPIKRAKAWIKEEEERQLLQAKIKEDEPKIEQYEDLLSMKSSHTMNEVAKIVGIGRNKLFAALREKHVLMKNNLPFETYKSRGYFEVREIIINHTNYEEVKRQTLVTISGIDWINKKMKQWNVK